VNQLNDKSQHSVATWFRNAKSFY